MDWTDDVWKERYTLIYRCWLSRIYHQKRERFFDLADSLTKAITLIAGTASIARVISPGGQLIVGVIITITSVLSLVIGYSKKARNHSDVAKAFMDIEAKIMTAGILTQEQVDNFLAEILRVEMNEPRTLGALMVICQNEIAEMQGEKTFINPVTFVKRVTAHFIDWDMSCSPHQALTK